MIKPTGDRVAVTPIDWSKQVEKQQSAIVLPEMYAASAARELEFRAGRVLSVGPKQETVITGEVVVWRKFTGVETQVGGEDVVILQDDELLAVLEGFGS